MSFIYLNTKEQVKALILEHNIRKSYVVLDTETTSKIPHEAKLIHIQMSGFEEGDVYMFGAEFAPLLLGLHVLQVWQNFKYDWEVLYHHGVDLRGKPMVDTMLLDHLRDENSEHSLEYFVQKNYGDNYKEAFWEKHKAYQEALFEEQLQYACQDILYTDKFYQFQLAELAKQSIPGSIIQHVHRLALALFDTELSGIAVDLPYTIEKGRQLQDKSRQLSTDLFTAVKEEVDEMQVTAWIKEIDLRKTPKGKQRVLKPSFNFDSSTQLKTLLYEKLKLPVQTNQKTHKPSTDDFALATLEGLHPVITPLRSYRETQKIYTSYIEGTLERVRGGRIYPSFSVNGTKTGRISHSSPNLGQLPREGGIRGIYKADENHVILSADYKQLEVVLAAHFSQDKNLLKVVFEGASLHDITAEGLGIKRDTAKTINFALQYGAGVGKIQSILCVNREEAEGALEKYWEVYAGLKGLIDRCHRCVAEGAPIVNPYGRCRRFPKEFETKWQLYKAQRQSFNALIQGTGGDITSEAFSNIAEKMCGMQAGKALFTVHDEVLVMPTKTSIERTSELVRTEMVGVGKRLGLTVPLSVELSEPCERWAD